MVRTILRYVWRVLILAVGVVGSWLVVFYTIKYADQQLPLFFVILLLYCLFAYVVIPLIFRLFFLFSKQTHIPRYVTTPDGWPADPVNIAIVAPSEKDFIAAMRAAGWYTADKATLKASLKQAWAVLFDRAYPTAPFSTFYLFGRPFDIGFQIPYGKNKSPRRRHHVRFWQLIDEPTIDTHNHFEYWLQRLKVFFGRKRLVWIGAAIEDSQPVGLRWRNLQITHHNSSDHMSERDYIIETLRQKKLIKSTQVIKDGEPFKMRSQNIGTSFIVDGYLTVVELRAPKNN